MDHKDLSAAASFRGLEARMRRVLEECDRAEKGLEAAAVHDLRVALRRCRTLADALRAIDPFPGWRDVQKACRPLFKKLGELRDVQVMTEWVLRLGEPEDAVRLFLLSRLLTREEELKARAARALKRFDRKGWKALARRLPKRAEQLASGGPAIEWLALERWTQAYQLHREALSKRSRTSWHRLRIGLKHFRYVVENLLPDKHAVWGRDLKRLQDVLGELHDLDLLAVELGESRRTFSGEQLSRWRERLSEEREARIAEYRRLASGSDSVWATWRRGFPDGQVARPDPRGVARSTR